MRSSGECVLTSEHSFPYERGARRKRVPVSGDEGDSACHFGGDVGSVVQGEVALVTCHEAMLAVCRRFVTSILVSIEAIELALFPLRRSRLGGSGSDGAFESIRHAEPSAERTHK